MPGDGLLFAKADRRQVRVVISANALAVRHGLRALFEMALLRDLTQAERGTLQILLAEVLNNVAEHAYAGGEGLIDVRVRREQSGLFCRIVDAGQPMPGGVLPVGASRDLDGPEGVPEGGFGWNMIHALTKDLIYVRASGENHLNFRVNFADAAA